MSKQVKQMLMDDLTQRLGDVRDMLVVDSSRIDVITCNRFRLALQEKGIHALTVRNTLAKKVFDEIGATGLDEHLTGPSTLVWGSEDIVNLSKEIAKWAKEIVPLEIKGGALEGKSLSADDVDELSKSPSREELLAQIVGLALSPGANISGALLGPGSLLASQIEKISQGDEAA